MINVRFLALLIFALPITLCPAIRPTRQNGSLVGIEVLPNHPSGIYGLHEKVGWTVSAKVGATPSLHYVVKRNNAEVIKTGDLDLASGQETIEVLGNEPEMLFMVLSNSEGKESNVYGAAVAPTKLRPVIPAPSDFNAFWHAKISLLHSVPENPVLTTGKSYKSNVEYSTIQMDHINGTHVYGQFAKPTGPGKFPALVLFQWASPPYPLDKSWVIEPAAKGFLTLDIEPHNVLPTEMPAYYANLPGELKNYQTIRMDDRDKSYFVEMYLRDFRAIDYISKRPDWDGKTLIVMGTSMGGQQSLCVAGLHPKITHLIVNEPAGCDLNASLHGRQTGYPFFPPDNPKVSEVAQYVDAINFAKNIHATCLVAMGFVDTVAPPTGIWTAFDQIKGPKEAAPMFDSPHNNSATPQEQKPFNDRSAAWLDSLSRTGRISIKR